MKKTRKKITFDALPRDFTGLCGVHTPRPIRDEAEYENTVEVINLMALHEKQFSRDQEDYFDVLCTLVERYDAEHTKWPELAPRDMLKSLLDEHNLKAADLSRILGVSRQLGPMILRGERNVTADHARVLAEYFKLSPLAFL